jgi:ActR/RegA family two-component response regulator
MTQVLVFIPDLLFGSRVQAALTAAGDEVVLAADANGARERLAGVDVLVVDLTDDATARAELVKSLSAAGSLDGIATLGFYSHIETSVRALAEGAGFDLVVPRSRMAREGASLIAGLVPK